MPLNGTCPICNVAFSLRSGGGKRQIYCSPACNQAAKSARRSAARGPRPTMVDRFWAKVNKDGPIIRPELGPCWVWTGARYSNGYGAFQIGGRHEHGGYQTTAHRVALALHQGVPVETIDTGCHSCDNPPCCNPAHLFDNTQAGNLEDMRQKGRRNRTGPPGGQLTEESVRQIRAEYAHGNISQQVLAERYGVNQRTISGVILRKTWQHVA